MLCPAEIDDSFGSIKEITESIENNNEGFQTDKRAIGNNGNYTNKVCRENQSCDHSRASLRDQTKQMPSPIKLGNNRPNATAWKDVTPEQVKEVKILGDNIIKHVRG